MDLGMSGLEIVGVEHGLSQQAVARLAPAAGFDFSGMAFPEQLVESRKQ